MNKVIFESISVLLCLFLVKDFSLVAHLELFVVLIIALRLIWNSAVLIHGLGHTLAIAVIDQQRSGLHISNILEHRSLGNVFKSLLPFSSIFIPGVDSTQILWLAAGKSTPWRIRLKAMGGISLNLLAIAFCQIYLAWGNVLESGNLNLSLANTLVLSLVVANLAIAVSSCTDIAACFTGMATDFYCGNFGFICQRLEQDEKVLLPERMLNMYYLMGRETEIRGEQAGGGLVVAEDRQQQTVFVGKKIVNKKRDNLTSSLETAFAKERKKSQAVQITPLNHSVTGVWHYRFGTSGPPAVAETHWHEWIGARQAKVWQFVEGQWLCQVTNVNHRITHNGDFDSWNLYGREIANKDLGLWLERVLQVSNYAQGDSPKIAGMMDLLITKGMWHASVRLAYHLAIAKSIESAFGEQEPSSNAPDTTPTEVDLASWVELFEETFLLYRFLLAATNSPSFNQYLCRLEQDILQAISENKTISNWHWQTRVNFVRTAIHAFFHNDPNFAVKTFMAGAEGSFGLVVVSTLDRDKLILSAQGQPISVGFNRQEGYMVYASEPAAVDSVLLNLPESYRLDLDQKAGEIAQVSANEIKIYSLGDRRELNSTELSSRWISMENHPYLPHVKYPQNNSPDPVKSDNQEIPAILAEIRGIWQNPASINCQTADYLVELLQEKANKFEQKREKMMRVGLPELTRQLPTVDLLIIGVENSLWLGERFAEDFTAIFPWFNIKSISSNEILQIMKYDFSSLRLGQDSIVLAVTQSGQTFPTLQAINTFDKLYRQGVIGELFIFTGELGSFLGSPVIKPKQSPSDDAPQRHKIFLNNSGRRTAEAATITVAAAHQTFTELLFYLAKKLRQAYPDSDPFGMTLAVESISVLEKMRDDFLEISVVQIMGTAPTGKVVKSDLKQKLINNGHQWAWHITETPTAWAIHALYVLITVGWAIPFGYTIPLAKTAWRLVEWMTQIPPDWLLLKLIEPAISLVDIGIYIFGSWLWTLGLRFFQNRQLFARLGKRTLVIGDVPWVNQILRNYVSKLFSLSYGIASLEVHGANPENDLLHDFGHRVVRGTLLFLGVPDGRRSQKLKQQQNAVIMTGKQADGVRNINVGPEVLAIGSNPEIAKQNFSSAIVLESRDDSFYDDLDYFQNPGAEFQRALIEELRESRFSSCERLLASYVFFWALAKKVASFPLLRYQHWKSQSRTKIMTTAAPVAGISFTQAIIKQKPKQGSAESNKVVNLGDRDRVNKS
jgi:hypothetical protein